jgi:serine/threonine-protein kinase HipA
VELCPDVAKLLMHEMAAQTDSVIAKVSAELPDDFPVQISNTIFNGLSKQAGRIMRG